MIYDSNGVPIHYDVFGEGKPIVLVHGFTSSFKGNWIATGWVETLRPIRQVIALDCRGHGESGKPHDAESYGGHEMVDDVAGLMDHLDIQQADLFGYSMGAGISLRAVIRHPRRFSSLVLGGIGNKYARLGRGRPGIPEALLAKDSSAITDPLPKGFRVLAERTNNDLEALAAYQMAERPSVDDAALAEITIPVLVVNGEGDALADSPRDLIAPISGAELVMIPGKNHLTVIPDQRFKAAVAGFLADSNAG